MTSRTSARAAKIAMRSVDRVYAAAGLPILHVPCAPSYHTEQLKAQIAQALA